MRCTHLTASRIKSYKDCEFKYFLEYHLMYPPLKVGNIYAEKGGAVHVALEKWANAKLGKTEDAEVDYERTLMEYYASTELWKLDARDPSKGGHPHPVDKSCETCPYATKDDICRVSAKPIAATEGCPRPNFSEDLDLIEKTLSRLDYNPLKLVKDADGERFVKKILGVEYKFKMSLEGIPVKGTMDLVLEEDENTLEICDYKTGRSMSYNAAFKDAQVRTYGAVARLLWPQYKYIIVTLHYLKTKPVTVPLDEDEDKLTMLSLHKYYKEISKNNRPRRVKNWLCKFCVGYDNCGKIYNNLRVDGKFRLPIISCNYASEAERCWGAIYPVGDLEIDESNVKDITYTCSGHSELYNGGSYIPEENVGATPT